MLFNNWLQNFVSTLAPRRAQRNHRRRGSIRTASHWLCAESLEDRALLSFSSVASLPVGPSPQAVVTADFNNDGLFDLASANTGGNSVSVRLGDGQGGFLAANHFVTDAEPRAIAVGDFNNDGNPDLVTATSSNNTAGPDPNTISVLMGNGNGTFQAPDSIVTTSGWEFPSIAVTDFNLDGNMDLVHTTVEDFQFEASEVMVMLGDGTGGFAYSGGHFPSTVPVGLVVADLNNDSWPDVVTANQYSDNVSVMLGNGDGMLSYSYSGSSEFAAGPSLRALAVGDFNGDGIPDLVTVGQSVDFLRGLGDGTFASPNHYSTSGVGQTSVATADFNGDGKLDVVTASQGDGMISLLLGSGDGTLQTPVSQAAGSSSAGLAVGTFNSDGYPDVAAADPDSNAVSVLLNDGNWSPHPPSLPAVSILDATVNEGHTSTRAATFTVNLSAASSLPVTVAYTTTGGTAVSGSDYLFSSGTLTIPAGQMSGTITVLVKGDRAGESNETFFVNLSNPTNATLTDAQGVGTILDDEPRISIGDVSMAEGKKGQTTLFTFTVTLSAAYDQPITMSYQTLNGSATSGTRDYVARRGTLTFAPGETKKTITIEVRGDSKREANETFNLDLFGNSSNSLFSRKRGLGTILNDD